jgi:hypothetical protein
MTGSERTVKYDGQLFRVEHQNVDGRDLPYEFVRRIGAVTMLPIILEDPNHPLALVVQNKRLYYGTSVSLPGGNKDGGFENPEPPVSTALRELREETGYGYKDGDKAIEEYKVNVLGTMHCIQAVIPKMLDKGHGSVVNISSIKGYPNLATMSTLTYAPSKAGVISLTKACAKAYPSIRFNAVAPGYVETDQVNDWNDETLKRINNGTIAGRIAQPKEIASLVMFLASDDASYITGADYLVDGGYSIQGK